MSVMGFQKIKSLDGGWMGGVSSIHVFCLSIFVANASSIFTQNAIAAAADSQCHQGRYFVTFVIFLDLLLLSSFSDIPGASRIKTCNESRIKHIKNIFEG